MAATAAARPTEFPNRTPKVERIFKSPDGHPNALDASPEGLWIGEQHTDRAHLVTWDTGKVIRSVETESSNTSGMAYGGGFLWMSANGPALQRPPRPHDVKAGGGEVVKCDGKTGETLARYPFPGGRGVHGLEYTREGLWVASMTLKKISLVDPKDFQLIRQIPLHLERGHGLARVRDGIWVVHTRDRVIQKLDVKDGTILEQISLAPGDPEPHGLCGYKGYLYYCDADDSGVGGKGKMPWGGWISRLKV
jgi:hypothetical protein